MAFFKWRCGAFDRILRRSRIKKQPQRPDRTDLNGAHVEYAVRLSGSSAYLQESPSANTAAVESSNKSPYVEAETKEGSPPERAAAITGEVVAALSSKQELFTTLKDAIRDNRHMEQLEVRVYELKQACEENQASIEWEEVPATVLHDNSAGERRLAAVKLLKQERMRIENELERFQSDAAVKLFAMRDQMRNLLHILDDLFVQAGELDAFEGMRDVDDSSPLIEGADETTTQAQRQWPLRDKLVSDQASEVSSSGKKPEVSTPRLARSGKTHQDLRAEVTRLEAELGQRVNTEHRLTQEYARARQDVTEAQRQFDLREARHHREEARFQARFLAGEDVGSITQFDLELLLDSQRLTQNLIEADHGLEMAKMKAVEADVDVKDDDRSSGFVSVESDGDRMSGDDEGLESINPEHFHKWMEKIPEIGIREGFADERLPEVSWMQRPDTDEWDARIVESWDSISLFAKGSNRKRIDRWERQRR